MAINKSPSMAATMLWGMLLMALCFWMYAIAVALMRVRAIMLSASRTPNGCANQGGARMNWNSAADFWAMGGYALYVWASFGARLLAMVVEPFLVRQRQNQLTTLRRQVLGEKLERNWGKRWKNAPRSSAPGWQPWVLLPRWYSMPSTAISPCT